MDSDVAASVLTLSPLQVFLVPSDKPHLAGFFGSLSPRLLRVSGGRLLLYVIPRLQGICVIGVGGLLLHRFIYVTVNGINTCRMEAYAV